MRPSGRFRNLKGEGANSQANCMPPYTKKSAYSKKILTQ